METSTAYAFVIVFELHKRIASGWRGYKLCVHLEGIAKALRKSKTQIVVQQGDGVLFLDVSPTVVDIGSQNGNQNY
jgi:hypothetical protein